MFRLALGASEGSQRASPKFHSHIALGALWVGRKAVHARPAGSALACMLSNSHPSQASHLHTVLLQRFSEGVFCVKPFVHLSSERSSF